MKSHVWNLRSSRAFRRLRSCFEKSRGRFGTRLVGFSVQGNHLHLIVEADDTAALSRAMQGLAIRIAKALNALLGLAGRVFDDHCFCRLLPTPTELVRAIRYVLQNHAHHFGASGGNDQFSSAVLAPDDSALDAPRGWLFRHGCRRVDPPLSKRYRVELG